MSTTAKSLSLKAGFLFSTFAAAPAMAELDEVRFGVPPWPGVTVKSEVAAQLMEAMGYETRQRELAVSVILEGLTRDDIDVYLGGWYPVQTDMVEPLVADDKVEKLVSNIQGANSGLVVPQYVYDAGVTSVADLDAHRDRFDGEIQGIEAGTGINEAILKAIDNDSAGLGDWDLRESSTSAMLAQAEQKMADEEWVTFVGWEPHWMNVSFDLAYLEDADDSGVAQIESTVWTIVPTSLAEQDPQLHRFLSQYEVAIGDQNDWVHEYSYEERPADEVAREWIGNNLDTVAEWLDGVETREGESAIEQVRADYP
ncbi:MULTISPECIES: ABC transporter substrate-binding protein [unclassified Halomonas]|uniref:ABC transporter substrate-binding protein n=1 Tax=unclassified Halomonas TaxID=2609666 RepID=UPI0006DB7E26|nr:MULTISPECIES: ABC transporter substrate-binding protein [unclassified Halomonas]KPQ22470.1 MAG: ABC-type osmolyte uptake system substrate-binding component [Halomonas sp. HL-93]SBR49922.1 glycine betaine/proline transport system substrate-binding protein [Halomonas sp. HL-93]SNY96596.1 glycine betaine/proline transport system substrate-binding protein [Halomonas sp. hl-4]